MKILKRALSEYLEIQNEFKYLSGNHYAWFVIESAPQWVPGQIPIFTYHGAEPVSFEQELRFLKDNGYQTIGARELYAFLTEGKDPGDKKVMLTFDDGFESVWTLGGPLLKKYGFQAISFIVPGWIGQPSFLSWDQVQAMKDSGYLDIQSHTQNHIPQVCGQARDAKQLEFELAESKAQIERHLPGHKVDHLCYPQGLGSEPAVAMSKKTGYASNFWCGRLDRNLNKKGDDPYYIVRLKHDYIPRLPGEGRRTMASIFGDKVFRRFRGQAYG